VDSETPVLKNTNRSYKYSEDMPTDVYKTLAQSEAHFSARKQLYHKGIGRNYSGGTSEVILEKEKNRSWEKAKEATEKTWVPIDNRISRDKVITTPRIDI
jgi:hypothetical protein